MTLVKNAFPRYDDDLPVIEGFDDYSYKNDACPCIGKDFGNEQYLMIYCDYKNPELSECHDGGEKYYRYCVILDLAMDRNQINPKVLGNYETIDEVKQLVLNKSVEDFINMEDVYAKS